MERQKEIEILGLKYNPVKINYTKLIIIASVLIVLNTLLYPTLVYGVGKLYTFETVLANNLIEYNLIGMFIGSIIAFLPYKGLSYTRRFPRAALLSIAGIHFLMLVALCGILTRHVLDV